MQQHLQRLLIFLILLIPFISPAQKFQEALLFGKKENRFLPLQLQGLPKDTFAIPKTPEDLTIYPFIADKDGTLYLWNIVSKAWLPVTGAGGTSGISSVFGRITPSIVAQAGDYAAFYPSLTGYNKTHWDSAFTKAAFDTTTRLLTLVTATGQTVPLLIPGAAQADISYVITRIDSLRNRVDTTIALDFNTGLLKAGKSVSALYNNALWNASKLQGYSITAAQPLDSSLLIYSIAAGKWQHITVNGLRAILGGGTGSGIADGNNYPSSLTLDASGVLKIERYGLADLTQSLFPTLDARYLRTETESLFTGSAAYGITSTLINNWNAAYSWGNHAGLYPTVSRFLDSIAAVRNSIIIPDFSNYWNKSQSDARYLQQAYADARYYPLNSNPKGYLTRDSVGNTSGGNTAYNGHRAITIPISGLQGFTPNTDSLKDFLDAVFYPSQPPSSGLSITYSGTTQTDFDFEYLPTGAALPITLNWIATRQASTATISSINVAGTNVSFSQPAQGASATGAVSATAPRNTTTVFTNTVTTSDGKTSSSNATIRFHWPRFWGYSATSNPTDAEILAAQSELQDTKAKTDFTIIVIGTDKHVFFATNAALGPLSSLTIGGFENINTFTNITRNVTTSTGAVSSYNIEVSNNTFSGNIEHVSTN